MVFWEQYFCTWTRIVTTCLFLKDYGIKEDELQAILNYLLTIHEVIFSLGAMSGDRGATVVCDHQIFEYFWTAALFMPQGGSVEEAANIVQLLSVVWWIANILAMI